MNMREMLAIGQDKLDAVNEFLLDENNPLINDLLAVVEKYGGVDEINRKAAEARKPENLMARLKDIDYPHLGDLEWLIEQRDKGAFISLADYCAERGVDPKALKQDTAVTLEISALQYFPWLRPQLEQCIAQRELMPGRVIRVRMMAEQEKDGDIMAVTAAAQLMGCSLVETLDTKGTDGSNIHLRGPETITGYFGGIGQPNDHPVKWLDEYLHYHTTYGTKQVLNINPGTVLVGYLVNKLGIDNEFKISVFMGNDNPYSVFWTLMTAKLFSRPDDTTSLIGFNLSNSVNAETIRQADKVRAALGLTHKVRFEHHITETYKSIVEQPYLRRDELLEVAGEVPNIAAKHEGGDPDVDSSREHPSNILEYFIVRDEVEKSGLMPKVQLNYMDKHMSVQRTADALVKAGIAVLPAAKLHR